MKNPVLIVVAIVAVTALGLGAYLFTTNSAKTDSVTPKESMSSDKTGALMEKIDTPPVSDKMATAQTGSRYIHYSKAAFDTSATNRRVIFFYASWCPTCKTADANLTQSANQIPEDVTVIRVNYNDPDTDQDEKDLAKKYGITYQHTYVQIDNQGKEVAKWNGGQIDELLSNIK